MRSITLITRGRSLLGSSAVVLAFGFLAACSNDVSRFTDEFTTNGSLTSNQHQIIHKSGAKAQPFPDGPVEALPTPGVSRSEIAANPLPAPPSVQATRLDPPAAPVSSRSPKSLAAQTSAPIVLPPKSDQGVKLRIADSDRMATGSVLAAAPKAQMETNGWDQAGGTGVVLREGETLYNLSRRYGVPVEAIQRANGIADASSVQAGARILIPAYTYSKSAPVSAPDNHPVTKNVRASKGFRGEATGPVPVPTRASDRPVKAKERVVEEASAPMPAPQIDKETKTGSIQKDTASKDVTSTGNLKEPTYLPPTATQKSETGEATANTEGSNGSFRWPTRGRIITRFGERDNGAVNDGIDISVPEGTPIKAAEAGTVIYSGSELADFGNLILVQHADGWVSAYAHASRNEVRRGDKVSRGQVIAVSGKTGNATVPKLHFELRRNSTPVNPLQHLSN